LGPEKCNENNKFSMKLEYKKYFDLIINILLFIVIYALYVFFSNDLEGAGPGDTMDDPIDLTQDSEDENKFSKDKGKDKVVSEQEDNTERERNLLKQFNDLVEKRAVLQNNWEEANKAWKKSGSDQDKFIAEMLGNQLDQVNDSIQDMVDNEGFLDPADDIREEDSD